MNDLDHDSKMIADTYTDVPYILSQENSAFKLGCLQ